MKSVNRLRALLDRVDVIVSIKDIRPLGKFAEVLLFFADLLFPYLLVAVVWRLFVYRVTTFAQTSRVRVALLSSFSNDAIAGVEEEVFSHR